MFVHHSRLHHLETAFFSLVRPQKVFIAGVLMLGIVALAADWRATLIAVFSALTIIYFLDLLFNTFVIYRSYSFRSELVVDELELALLKDETCPMYTIFCPLYKEPRVVSQFVQAMMRLEYPHEKLQVLFLLEENDAETIAAVRRMDLPPHFEIVIVPHSQPKTKPKAMNYGLQYAKGEYIVVYDAEDVPEPDQLKKAVIAFSRVEEDVVCIQAKLNFYNPRQNILTRVFTTEYSLWFDLVLPGLQSIDAPLPLGGTSNHFKAEKLRALAGWDAFNVTEDCDLGMRLAKRGFRTAMMDSTTHEEANSNVLSWFNQRSRWIKGYIQTYFVHMRAPSAFKRRRDLFFFQLTVGGKVTSLFINPLMWVMTAAYFLLRGTAGATLIETFFPGPILYIGVASLLLGNFLYLYLYMAGCAKRGYDDLIKYVFLVPFYWLGMSAAAWKALYEFLVRPHYWAKTAHGLHLTPVRRAPTRAGTAPALGRSRTS